MARFLRHQVVGEVLKAGLVPVFYVEDLEVAFEVVNACSSGGAHMLEFMNRGDHAITVFEELMRRLDRELPEAILGAGTIVDASTAAQYINAGANFIVGPSFSEDVARLCNRRKVLYVPGCQTPSEIGEAEELGAEIVKLFPASSLGPGFVKDIRGPSPQTLLMPSGGIELKEEQVKEWVRAGAIALNMGSALIRKDLLAERRYGEIKEATELCLGWIKAAKTGK